jgi:hypothetical protein
MVNEGFGHFEMTGRWVGFYRHRFEQLGAFPITAELQQDGNRITGEMYDQITDRSEFLETMVEIVREEISPVRRIQLEKVIQRFGSGTVEVESRLPETSDIDGKVDGHLVTFTKAYRGSMEIHWKAHGKPLGSVTRENHKVHYAGQLDLEKGCIVGEWIIRRRGWLGRFLPPEARGGFELYRKS